MLKSKWQPFLPILYQEKNQFKPAYLKFIGQGEYASCFNIHVCVWTKNRYIRKKVMFL